MKRQPAAIAESEIQGDDPVISDFGSEDGKDAEDGEKNKEAEATLQEEKGAEKPKKLKLNVPLPPPCDSLELLEV